MCVGRSSSVRGSTGAAFAIALQTSIAQVGGIVSPQMFRSQFKHNGYKVPFGICVGTILLSAFTNGLNWYLTKDIERELHQASRMKNGKGKATESDPERLPSSPAYLDKKN